MQWKTMLFLIIGYFVYLVLGAAVFYLLENGNSAQLCIEAHEFFSKLNATEPTTRGLSNAIEEAYQYQQAGIRFINGTVICHENWDYQSCVFFAGTIITTIGYGHLVPTSGASKTFCVIYALIGIPIFTIMFGAIGDLFGEYMKRFMGYLDKRAHMNHPVIARSERNKRMIHAWILLLVFGSLGFILFCVLPALLFRIVEKWEFSDSLYFTIITLTTIGFGDYVPGSEPGHKYVFLYRTMVYFWIICGLAYTATFLKVISNYLIKRAEEIFKSKDDMATSNVNHSTASTSAYHVRTTDSGNSPDREDLERDEPTDEGKDVSENNDVVVGDENTTALMNNGSSVA